MNHIPAPPGSRVQPVPGTATAPSSPPRNLTPWWTPRPFSNQTPPSARTTLQPDWAHQSLVFGLRSWHCLPVQQPSSDLAQNPNPQAILPCARLHTCGLQQAMHLPGSPPGCSCRKQVPQTPCRSASFSCRGYSASAILHDTVSLSGCDVEGSNEIWGEKKNYYP